MKKFIIKTGFACIVLFLFLPTIHAQAKEARQVGNFSKINVSSGIDLIISQGDRRDVVAEARNDEMLKSILTEIEGNTLKIYSKEKKFKPGPRKVYVTFTNIDGIKATGGSDITAESAIDVSNLEIGAHGGSDVSMEIKADEVKCNISGGSDADLKGAVKRFTSVASGGSDLRAKELVTGICNLEVSGGSDACITVKDELNVHASGGSDVTYYGDASIKNINANGGSDVVRR
jgi:hypothetical protein